jgi:hypothetical protein
LNNETGKEATMNLLLKFIAHFTCDEGRSAGRKYSACVVRALLTAALLATAAQADEDLRQPAGSEDDIRPSVVSKPAVSAEKRFWQGRVELKRENTERGTPEETTKTTVKIEMYPPGVLSLVRLEVPFPDEQTDLEGSPFDPRLGDIKLRVGFGPFPGDGMRTAVFLEATFPTADPESLGKGKYQLSPGMTMRFPVPVPDGMQGAHTVTFSPLLQQYVSVAGDEDRKDINYTKLELTLRDVMRTYWLALKVKPVVDWEQDAKTGAVAELEGGKLFGRVWSSWLMLGARLWGEGVSSTYGTRITLGVARMF